MSSSIVISRASSLDLIAELKSLNLMSLQLGSEMIRVSTLHFRVGIVTLYELHLWV